MAILISHQLAVGRKSVSGGLLKVGTNLGVCAKPVGNSELLLARSSSPERASPNGSKPAPGLPAVIELKNEFTGNIERNGQGNHGRAGVIGRRIVLDHGAEPPFPSALRGKPAYTRGDYKRSASIDRPLAARGTAESTGEFTPVRKWVPARPTKFGDQLSNRPTAMVQCVH